MDLALNDIRLENFRNHDSFKGGPFGSLNIFIGSNGAGKTNILEGIQLITSLESFRNPKWDEVVRHGEEISSINAHAKSDSRDLEIRLRIEKGKRRYFLNGKGKKSADLRALIPSVLFNPDDLQLVKGNAEKRRDGLDSIGVQISTTYHDLRKEYQRSIRQKNRLLQSQEINSTLVDIWNENICLIATSYVKHRLRLFILFRRNFLKEWSDLSPNLKVEIAYAPSWEIEKNFEVGEPDYKEEQLRERIGETIRFHKDAEIAAHRSLVGPHKDDIHIYLDGADARKFASQGQQRLIALAWKIAEMETIKEITGQTPLLLLDDVLSELDHQKKALLLDYLLKGNQTFITSTDIDAIDDRILSGANIFKVGTDDGFKTGN